MGWRASEIGRDPYLILSTAGGLRAPNGSPVALGYHTGHWEIDRLVKVAAETFTESGVLPFAAACSDPCDGRSQGTTGMFDSLPYRNDAAITFRRLIRSLPLRKGVLGIATCDKGLPAMMLALAGCGDLPGVIVPGGVTLPARGAEDAGKVQTIGARFVHGLIDLQHAADMGCRACGSPGGGCQFLGTAATSQVVAEALGIALPHSALCPSGEPVWLDMARRSGEEPVGVSGGPTNRRIHRTTHNHRNVGGWCRSHRQWGIRIDLAIPRERFARPSLGEDLENLGHRGAALSHICAEGCVFGL
jgi:dihydroxyacid dehydratase/phosphogluconate dehydratase